MDDLKVVRPHMSVTVPGVLIKIESAVKLRFESEESGLMDGFMNRILSKAIEWKWKLTNSNVILVPTQDICSMIWF
ncbi:hypothetical protein WICPIJ_003649 [Wickerhamomyces pijperi]|uniref:Uncharacterized protein n=1 Tax=Wickerhamomyces pijperi TaxID=599730 RepID=A0A9P8Q9J5_WICPI|nr:hypothetical protein WICPIJ_003649 [Wickerhamomyces pijperi]